MIIFWLRCFWVFLPHYSHYGFKNSTLCGVELVILQLEGWFRDNPVGLLICTGEQPPTHCGEAILGFPSNANSLHEKLWNSFYVEVAVGWWLCTCVVFFLGHYSYLISKALGWAMHNVQCRTLSNVRYIWNRLAWSFSTAYLGVW